MKVKSSTILGVKIDDVSIQQITEIVKNWLSEPGKHQIVTPNPEILVMAQKDAELKSIINNADLSIPDGNGLKIGSDIVCNSPGIDTLEALVKLASDLGFTVGFLGGGKGVAEKTAERLQKKYTNLKISFAEEGGEVDNNGDVAGSKYYVLSKKTKENKNSHTTNYQLLTTDLLFVAFGPPKQEKWIAKNLDKLPVKVVMGVGGSFDYISGKVIRAPKVIRLIGFEWLFRLILQPWRLKRQLALFEYIWLLTKHRLGW